MYIRTSYCLLVSGYDDVKMQLMVKIVSKLIVKPHQLDDEYRVGNPV